MKLVRRLCAAAACMAVTLGAVGAALPPAAAETLPAVAADTVTAAADGYAVYAAALTDCPDAAQAITLAGGAYIQATDGLQRSADYGTAPDAVLLPQGTGTLTYELEVPQTALYTLSLRYASLEGNGLDIRVGLRIDGEYPFSEAAELSFPRMWHNESETWKQDKDGNDLTPEQTEYRDMVDQPARDGLGVEVEPYVFRLTAGRHTITVEGGGEAFALGLLCFLPPERLAAYTAPTDLTDAQGVQPIVLQGESATYKSSSAMVPKGDNTDAAMTPASAENVRLNYIGGSSWAKPNASATWSFRVKQAGYYKLAFRFKQDQIINAKTYRRLKIDGVTPFAEAACIAFPYATKWQAQVLANAAGEECLVWLEAGDHTVTMESTLGAAAAVYGKLQTIVQSLGDTYTSVVMVTGESPDAGRDYELFRSIPGFEDTLRTNMEALDALVQELQTLSGKKSTQAIASMQNMRRVLRLMLERPYIAHQYLSDYYSNYCSVSAWMNDMSSMPLALDELRIVYHSQEAELQSVGVLDRLLFSLRRFINSFRQNDGRQATVKSETKLRLWVNWGRDQTRALSSLIQDSFTAGTGIEVDVQMVNATLVQGIMSGNAPDLALQMSRAEPVNLGIRNALMDLKSFPDYEEVLQRFQPGAEVPYCYNGRCYALPDTQSYMVMFYRTDILEKLELEVPNTWEGFIRASTVIQRHNMQVYLPYTRITSGTTVNAGIGSLNLYPTLMLQNKLPLYDDAQTATVIGSEQSVSVFDSWTRMYTDYQFMKEADFYNRFRTGSMPLGIAGYTTCLTLSQTAAEIDGRWAMAPVPAADGEHHTVAGSGTGCAILSTTDKAEQAWEFLKWWTSAETQERYSKNVESVLGTVGRVATSNVEAFKKLSWSATEREQLLAQWSQVQEIPEIPGSYYLSRALDQAYWEVLNGVSNSMDAVNKWSDIANEEISRKVQEYEYLEEGRRNAKN